MFDWVLALIAEKGERIGVDASTMEANAALRNIAEGHGRGLPGDAGAPQESGIETPTKDLARLEQAQGQEAEPAQ